MNTDRETYEIQYLVLECVRIQEKDEKDAHMEVRVGDYTIYDEELSCSIFRTFRE